MPWLFRPRVGPFMCRPSRRRPPSIAGAVVSLIVVVAFLVALLMAVL